jgi:Phage integrase, N-terminal SAM-like domain
MDTSVATPCAAPPLRLLDQVRARVRYLHYSLRTEQAYVHWVRAFVRFHGLRHPRALGGPQVEAFLSWLSVERQVSVSTHRQALSSMPRLRAQMQRARVPWEADARAGATARPPDALQAG